MNNNKVTLPRDVAEAIEKFIADNKFEKTDGEIRSILVAEHCGQDWRNYELGQYKSLNKITTFDLMSALVNGYTIEQTPEEKVREYYDSQAFCPPTLVSRYSGRCEGVKQTLDLLGIKIEGVNA